ncbi:hypothetical protein A2716_03620 [candidate division WWE3 bacterium RIFCSPHIGHO2_01_FULL_40_23]|uniref:Uncharacterized protein n=1 Tax=candidate division WWE3 bacterium RIFCSPLOWO2_01_FULL_41_18 TaxID=1802625 RepID=A0A1F4VD96_UNCKA|nr:MAG: hypothetical protein A2716_03620 [candidate division WWE3 bacterium RIFCSPHIGHO2_01_FULL_40_23]OGC54968.1 MAG: hypothetical protein A3A78_03230 [candidate division WWE3 bacterium RIFCSPLOWO2_01_FULL_41_18]
MKVRRLFIVITILYVLLGSLLFSLGSKFAVLVTRPKAIFLLVYSLVFSYFNIRPIFSYIAAFITIFILGLFKVFLSSDDLDNIAVIFFLLMSFSVGYDLIYSFILKEEDGVSRRRV